MKVEIQFEASIPRFSLCLQRFAWTAAIMYEEWGTLALAAKGISNVLICCLLVIHPCIFFVLLFQFLSEKRKGRLIDIISDLCFVTSCFILKCNSSPVSGHLLFPYALPVLLIPDCFQLFPIVPMSIYSPHYPVVHVSYSARKRFYSQFQQLFLFACFRSVSIVFETDFHNIL